MVRQIGEAQTHQMRRKAGDVPRNGSNEWDNGDKCRRLNLVPEQRSDQSEGPWVRQIPPCTSTGIVLVTMQMHSSTRAIKTKYDVHIATTRNKAIILMITRLCTPCAFPYDTK